MSLIHIDGGYGEAGGQIIRTAVALSAVTGKPCRITGIRAKRRNPGLQRQHVAAVNAVAMLCSASVRGNELGSMELEFNPGEIKGGTLELDIGSAGSIALVLQALMIPAMHSETPLNVRIKGGTINKWAPSVAYVQNVTLPMLRKMGYKGEIQIKKHGFFPKGGGLVEANFERSELKKIELLKRGKPLHVSGIVVASENLKDKKVAEKMKKYATESLLRYFQINPEITADYVHTLSTGGGIDLFVLYENSILGANAIAEPGKSSESVAREAVNALSQADESGAPLDEHMADQLLPFLAFAGGSIKVEKITGHCLTNMQVTEKFLGVKFEVDNEKGIISVNPV